MCSVATTSKLEQNRPSFIGVRETIEAIFTKSPEEYIQEFRVELEAIDQKWMETDGQIMRPIISQVPAGFVRVQFFESDAPMKDHLDPDIERLVPLEPDGCLNLRSVEKLWGLEECQVNYWHEGKTHDPRAGAHWDVIHAPNKILSAANVRALVYPRFAARGWASQDPEPEKPDDAASSFSTPIIITERSPSTSTLRRRKYRTVVVKFQQAIILISTLILDVTNSKLATRCRRQWCAFSSHTVYMLELWPRLWDRNVATRLIRNFSAQKAHSLWKSLVDYLAAIAVYFILAWFCIMLLVLAKFNM